MALGGLGGGSFVEPRSVVGSVVVTEGSVLRVGGAAEPGWSCAGSGATMSRPTTTPAVVVTAAAPARVDFAVMVFQILASRAGVTATPGIARRMVLTVLISDSVSPRLTLQILHFLMCARIFLRS
jgi:hypothetical protein